MTNWQLLEAAEPGAEGPSHELFGSRRWAETLSAAYGWRWYWLFDGEDNYFPLAVLDDEAGKRVSVYPFSDYLPLDVLCRDPADLAVVQRILTERFPNHLIQLKILFSGEAPPAPAGWQVSREAVAHRWYATDPAPRATFGQKVRQAGRRGVSVRARTDRTAAARFYALYQRQRLQRFGLLSQPPGFMTALHQQFMTVDQGFYLEALYEERVVGSFVVLRCGEGLFHKFSATSDEGWKLRPNNLLYHALQEMVRAGEARFLDFGLSGTGDAYKGLRAFKSATGAPMHPVRYWTLTPPGYPVAERKAFLELPKALTKTLVTHRAPLALREAVSTQIYPFFA